MRDDNQSFEMTPSAGASARGRQIGVEPLNPRSR
jgi:hypothetical protein